MQVPTSLLLSCKWRLLLSRGKNILPRRAGGEAGQEAEPFAGLLRARGAGWGGGSGGKGAGGCPGGNVATGSAIQSPARMPGWTHA